MGYNQGTVRGSSIALLVFSIILLVFYIGCSNSCRYESSSLYSPIWTSLWGITIASLGIGMTVSKTETRWGGCFLALCIICIFMALGCMILTLVAFFAELLYVPPSVFLGQIEPTPSPSPSSTFNRDAAAILWLCMMGTAGVMTIISIVASCMFCCCQVSAQPVVSETRVVITGGIPTTGQTIVLNNQEFVLHPVVSGTTTVVTEDLPPPYSTIANQPTPINGTRPIRPMRPDEYMPLQRNGNTTAATSVTNLVDSGEYAYVECNDANNISNPPVPTTPIPQLRPNEYMQLQRDPNPTAATNVTHTVNSGEYAYVDCNDDDNAKRERIPTPDEYYDDVGVPQRSSSQHSGDSNYDYASDHDLIRQATTEEGQQYLNSSVQRPRNVSNPKPELNTPEYLEVLP
ncbi:uncharacterized protein [Amphiura filiformis]|uniref:uncharacterized protein n=1 Tax=Amphiura filiformis TaxID=82378 RepID=UPI003B223107